MSVGKVNITTVPVYTNEAIAALPAFEKDTLHTKYLYYAMQAQNFSLLGERAAKGITLNKAKLNTIKIPLPPLPTQQKIAAILDAADALRQKDKALLARYDALLQSTFHQLFGDPVKNEMGWEVMPVKNIGQVITGNTPPREQKEFYGNDIEWIKTDNIIAEGTYPSSATEGLSKTGLKVGRTAPQNALLITCIAGSISSIGRTNLLDREVAFNQQINALVPNQDKFDAWFLLSLFSQGKKIIQGAATNGMKHILTKGNFEKLEFIAPPLSLQTHFATIAQNIQQQKALVKSQVMASEALFQSLLHRAFAGELAAIF